MTDEQLEELRKIAEKARDEPYSDDILDCPAFTDFQMKFNPSSVLSLLDLIKQQREALKEASDCIFDLGSGKGGWAWEDVLLTIDAALKSGHPHR